MSQFELLASFLLFVLSLVYFLFHIKKNSLNGNSSATSSGKLPRSYPLIGASLSLYANAHRRNQWQTEILKLCSTKTFVLRRSLGVRLVITANPANVQHMLKTHFNLYPKGDFFRLVLSDFLGSGIFNADGETWKFQRQISSHEFNTKSLRKFVETVVETELSDRLIPILSNAASEKTVLDLQDILQRFAFDNICKISFGFDPEYLLPSLPPTKFAVAFEDAVRIISARFNYVFPATWKIKRALNIGSEKHLRIAISQVRDFAQSIVREKKQELEKKSSLETVDLLSRILNSSNVYDENFVTDIVISFILAGRDTTSAALTWYFWLLAGKSSVQEEILKEIVEKREAPIYDEVKDMVYTHASLCESMRLFPPVPSDTKEAVGDDVLPDGTVVKKGTRVTYHPYAMGRMEEIWGSDWPEFRPERWLEKDEMTGKWSFIGRDPYTYPVFQAGPRICLGKEMAFLQMKRMVAGILRRFRVVPALEKGEEPVFISYLSSKMKGGFPVRIEERESGLRMTKTT